MRLTVVHVLASTRADHGGTSRSVPALCEALDEQGVDVHLVTAAPSSEEGTAPILPGGNVTVHLIEEADRLTGAFRRPVGFYRRLQTVIREVEPDLIHDHGAWLPSNAVAAGSAWWNEIPFVLAPRGMLTEWSLSHRAGKKRVAWHAYQRWILSQVDCFHVTASAEADELRTLGFEQPATVVPNGVSLPKTMPDASQTEEKRALFLSRLHPKKGLPMLLEAWAQVRPRGWTLELVGPSEDGHRAALEQQAADLGINEVVQFSGPVDDAQKWKKYAAADLFVLPSHSENFGIVVAEALAAGVPVITTTGTPWQELETHNCGWWVDPDPSALAEVLSHATSFTDEHRIQMGELGKSLVEERYTWKAVGRRMKEVYEEIGKQSAPSEVTYTSD